MSKIKSKKNASGTTPAAGRRGFVHLSRAWYGPSNLANRTDGLIDDVMFTTYTADGGTLGGELVMAWNQFGAKLGAYSDAFIALRDCADVIRELANLDPRHQLQPDEFCAILTACGFEDMTQTKQGKR